jgi:hypothetical protein
VIVGSGCGRVLWYRPKSGQNFFWRGASSVAIPFPTKTRLPAHPEMGIDHRIDSSSIPFLAIGHVRIVAEWHTKT